MMIAGILLNVNAQFELCRTMKTEESQWISSSIAKRKRKYAF